MSSALNNSRVCKLPPNDEEEILVTEIRQSSSNYLSLSAVLAQTGGFDSF
jgi:hypothetical protein